MGGSSGYAEVDSARVAVDALAGWFFTLLGIINLMSNAHLCMAANWKSLSTKVAEEERKSEAIVDRGEGSQ